MLEVRELDGGITFGVKVVPGASKTEFVGWLGEMAKIKVAAAAEKGKANKALIAFLSKRFRIGKGNISITSGETSKVKRIKITGVSREDVFKNMCLK